MPEIGQTLRETRMRNRVDITEVEAGTKIRAKYLRALENEEWDLLPGPTFVKTFLRSYADYLGLDSRLLVEEYKQRFERPSTGGADPVRAAAGAGVDRRRERRRRPWLGPRLGGRVRARAGAGRAVSRSARGATRTPAAAASPTTVEKPTATPSERQRRAARARRRRRERVTLQIVPTGLVYVCLVDANGRALIDNHDLNTGETTRRFRGRRFRVSFGNGNARMRSDGRTTDVPDRSTPVGFELRPGRRPRELSEARRPTCS